MGAEVARFHQLEQRVAGMKAQAEFFRGQLAQHEAARAALQCRLNENGLGGMTFQEAEATLRERLAQQLAAAEKTIKDAEDQFTALRK